MTRRARALAGLALGMLVVGCGAHRDGPDTTSDRRTPASSTHRVPVCDPGVGFPRLRAGCPDRTPRTGWVSTTADDSLVLQRFRTYVNDEEGRRYAERHDLEFPFSNDYHDAPVGPPRPVELTRRTVCTGAILIGHNENLPADHLVDCALFRHARIDRVPAAVWDAEGEVVQLSELYRP